MNAPSDEELCAFVSALGSDQFERVMVDIDAEGVILAHVMRCSNGSCLKAFNEYDRALIDSIKKEEETLSAGEKWRRDLLNRQILDALRNRGVIR